MKANIMRSFAMGILLASSVCGAVYFLGSDSKGAESTKTNEKISNEEMKKTLTSEGYVVLTEAELQDQLAAVQVNKEDKENNKDAEKIVYRTMLTITSGMTSIDVGQALERAQIIKSGKEFFNAVERKGLSKGLRPGTYEVQSDMTMDQIIAMIYKKQ
jgi:cell division protein YceG involved in septum cleavage